MCGIRDQHSRCMSRNTHLAVSTNGRRPLLISTSLALIDRVVRLASTAALEVRDEHGLCVTSALYGRGGLAEDLS